MQFLSKFNLSMMTGVAFIQGGSRGIGLQFCKHILATRKNCNVVVSCRDPGAAHHLQNMGPQFQDR